MFGQRPDDGEDSRVLQERQPPGPEVVQQRAERLRAHRHPLVDAPGAVQVERGPHGPEPPASVDTAHPIDRDLLDQELVGDQRLVAGHCLVAGRRLARRQGLAGGLGLAGERSI